MSYTSLEKLSLSKTFNVEDREATLEEILVFNYFVNWDLWHMQNNRDLVDVYHFRDIRNASIVLRSLFVFLHGIEEGLMKITEYEAMENKTIDVFKKLQADAIEFAVKNVDTLVHEQRSKEMTDFFGDWYKINVMANYIPFWNQKPLPPNSYYDELKKQVEAEETKKKVKRQKITIEKES